MTRWTWMLLAAAPLLAQKHYDDRTWKLEDQETVRRTFDVSSGSGGKKLLVDNVSGFVHVTGYSGSQVQVTAEKHIYAETPEAMQEAKRDVKLDLTQQGAFARVYVDGPFRGSNGTNYRGDDYYRYRVVYDFTIQTPADTEVVLKNVNDGDIQLKKTTGDYEIGGLNGGIEMDGVSGSGKVHTLNGKVSVTFDKNPLKATSFKTLNGPIDVYFRPGLNADLSFQRLNGEIYTDFDVSAKPTTVSGNLSGGRFIYRGDRAIGGRAGSGGPELAFQTLNGTIRLHTK